MLSPRSSAARLVRSAAIGAWVTLAAIVAHVLADGAAPPAVVVVPVAGAATTTAWWAAERRLSLPTVFALLAVPQVVVHLLTGYVHGHVIEPSPAMLTAHVLAIGATALAIAHVERLWWALWRWWTRRLEPLVASCPLVATTLFAGVGAPSCSFAPLLDGALSRRGPPIS